MTLLRRFSLIPLVLAALLALAACGDGGDDLDTDYPPAGEDRFESTTATVQLEITTPGVSALPVALGALETVQLEGPLVVMRGDPQDEDGDGRVEVPTEIVEMALSGTSSFGPVTVRESPDRESKGMVEQIDPGQDFPADSFFDVYVEIDVEDLPSFTAHNEEPLRMQATLTDLPPAEGDEYLDAQGRPLPIYTESGVEIGRVVDALHIPNPGPGPGPGPGGGSPEATPTEEPEETPEGTETVELVLIEESAGCEHPQGATQSELQKRVVVYRVPADESRERGSGAGDSLVVAPGEAIGSGRSRPALGSREPLAGVTVTARAQGSGLIPGEETKQEVTDDDGVARFRFGIRALGTYQLSVGSVQAPDGTLYQFAPDSQLTETFTVGQTCQSPEGW